LPLKKHEGMQSMVKDSAIYNGYDK
jgi:hypothetical protein